MDNVATLVSRIQVANRSRLFTGVVFLDVVGAFDNVVPSILLCILERMGFPNKIIKFIRTVVVSRSLLGYLSGRFVEHRTSSRGLPQGSVLSPLLFAVYTSYIDQCLPLPVHMLMYADHWGMWPFIWRLDCRGSMNF